MKIDRRTRAFLEDTVEHASYAVEFVVGIDRSEFEDNREEQFGGVRALEVVGEAAKSAAQPMRDSAPNEFVGMCTRHQLNELLSGLEVDLV